jgi:L-alanine-DL-glutamate epimerase-like enolase superfamily enzyme
MIGADAYRTERDVDVQGDLAKAGAVHKLLGDGFPLAFDANHSHSVSASIRVGRELEQLGYRWFEEPVQRYHVQAVGEGTRRACGSYSPTSSNWAA